MACNFCGSEKEAEFNTEMNVHRRGLNNIDSPGVLLFPKILVCLNCGSSRFAITESQLSLLTTGTQTTEVSIARRNVEHSHPRLENCA